MMSIIIPLSQLSINKKEEKVLHIYILLLRDKVKYKRKSNTKCTEKLMSRFVCEQRSSVHVVINSAGKSVGFRVTPSLILRPPSSSAPAYDSGWSSSLQASVSV